MNVYTAMELGRRLPLGIWVEHDYHNPEVLITELDRARSPEFDPHQTFDRVLSGRAAKSRDEGRVYLFHETRVGEAPEFYWIWVEPMRPGTSRTRVLDNTNWSVVMGGGINFSKSSGEWSSNT